MACCGKSRQTYEASPHAAGFTTPTGAPIFEYRGATALTVIGAGTGRVYRFERSGARMEIDRRDQELMARVPNLRRIQ